jgi:mono/diheme cytochrome c family protein
VIWLALALVSGATAAPDDGRAVYAAKCQACHGAEGRGDGPAARALPRKPRDFSSSEFWASTTDARVRAVITQGLPGSIMRGYPMPPAQLDALLAYLRSFEGKAPAPAPAPRQPGR